MKKNNIGFLFAALFSITGCSAVRETFDQDQFHTNDFKLNYYHGTPSKYLVADNYRETIINATGRVTFNSPFDNAYNAIILSDVLNGDIPSIDEAIALYGDDKVKAIKLEDYASEVEYIFAINESLARPDNLKASYFHYAELNSMTTGANFSETIKNAFKQGIFSKLTDTLIVCDGSGSLVRIQIDETGMGQTFSHELIDYRNFVISARGGTSIDYGKEGIPSVRSANVRMKISFFIEKSTTSEALKYTLIYDVPEMSSDNNSLTTVMTMDLTSLLPAEALKRVNGMTINYELLDHDYLMPGGVKNDTTDYEFALMLYEVMFPYSVWR